LFVLLPACSPVLLFFFARFPLSPSQEVSTVVTPRKTGPRGDASTEFRVDKAGGANRFFLCVTHRGNDCACCSLDNRCLIDCRVRSNSNRLFESLNLPVVCAVILCVHVCLVHISFSSFCHSALTAVTPHSSAHFFFLQHLLVFALHPFRPGRIHSGYSKQNGAAHNASKGCLVDKAGGAIRFPISVTHRANDWVYYSWSIRWLIGSSSLLVVCAVHLSVYVCLFRFSFACSPVQIYLWWVPLPSACMSAWCIFPLPSSVSLVWSPVLHTARPTSFLRDLLAFGFPFPSTPDVATGVPARNRHIADKADMAFR